MKEFLIEMNHASEISNDITACIGYFDGLHKGHQMLIQKVVACAKQDGTIPALITFEPDPWVVLKKLDHVSHITSMEDRKELAAAMGIQYWIVLQFNEEMAHLSVEDFHTRILKPLHLKTLVCGYDFHYGIKGMGNTDTLRSQQDFHVEVIDKISSHNEKISSSRIEECIRNGDMEEAAYMLTRPYFIKGTVVEGKKRGRTIGFPTANLSMSHSYIYPKTGVYIGSVKVKNNWHSAIINVGDNPTFQDIETIIIEAHLLDFHADIYGEKVVCRFHKWIRGEVRFQSGEALMEQLKKDEVEAQLYFEKRGMLLCD